jgi:hypothetical protein
MMVEKTGSGRGGPGSGSGSFADVGAVLGTEASVIHEPWVEANTSPNPGPRTIPIPIPGHPGPIPSVSWRAGGCR